MDAAALALTHTTGDRLTTTFALSLREADIVQAREVQLLSALVVRRIVSCNQTASPVFGVYPALWLIQNGTKNGLD